VKASVKVALGVITFAVAGTVVGIFARLPYQFGGTGDPARVSEDFIGKGTAVSPPLVALAALIVAMAAAARGGVVGRVGSGLLALLAAVFFVATLGEVFGAGVFSGVTQAFVIAWNLVGAAIIAAMGVFAVREALGRG
jgi:hypothetical protein